MHEYVNRCMYKTLYVLTELKSFKGKKRNADFTGLKKKTNKTPTDKEIDFPI